MIVVSDSSPIISLAATGQLNLLRELYGKVLIPPAVYREMTSRTAIDPGAREVSTLSWIETIPVVDRVLVSTLANNLGAGEAEAMALAIQVRADFLLIDERHGRDVAARLGVKVVGLMGVLLEAKHRSIIPAIKPILTDLRRRGGMWLSEALYEQTLRAAGE